MTFVKCTLNGCIHNSGLGKCTANHITLTLDENGGGCASYQVRHVKVYTEDEIAAIRDEGERMTAQLIREAMLKMGVKE